MKTLPISQMDQSDIYKRVTTIGSPGLKLLSGTKKWIDETLFMEKEAVFLSWMVFKSQNFSSGKRRDNLVALHENLLCFKNHDLRNYLSALKVHEVQLTRQINCRYPPVALGDMYEVQGQLESQFEEISNAFKGLKINTFDAIDEFLTISIY